MAGASASSRSSSSTTALIWAAPIAGPLPTACRSSRYSSVRLASPVLTFRPRPGSTGPAGTSLLLLLLLLRTQEQLPHPRRRPPESVAQTAVRGMGANLARGGMYLVQPVGEQPVDVLGSFLLDPVATIVE